MSSRRRRNCRRRYLGIASLGRIAHYSGGDSTLNCAKEKTAKSSSESCLVRQIDGDDLRATNCTEITTLITNSDLWDTGRRFGYSDEQSKEIVLCHVRHKPTAWYANACNPLSAQPGATLPRAITPRDEKLRTWILTTVQREWFTVALGKRQRSLLFMKTTSTSNVSHS